MNQSILPVIVQDYDTISLIGFIITIVSLIITIVIFYLNEFYYLRSVKEQKNKKMFDWVHEYLIGNIYVPLCMCTSGICKAIKWEILDYENLTDEYRKNIFLYEISKFFYYTNLNRSKVGGDKYFIKNKDNIGYLDLLFGSIIYEICFIIEQAFESENTNVDDKISRRIITIEFLSNIGACKSYTEFLLSIKESASVRASKVQLKDCNNAISNLFGDSPCDKWKQAKLYSYCYLFNYLMSYELYNMYDSWYEGKKIPFYLKGIFVSIMNKNIKKISKYIKEKDEQCKDDAQKINSLDAFKNMEFSFPASHIESLENELSKDKENNKEFLEALQSIRRRKMILQNVDELYEMCNKCPKGIFPIVGENQTNFSKTGIILSFLKKIPFFGTLILFGWYYIE
jgi:hypothetical protein